MFALKYGFLSWLIICSINTMVSSFVFPVNGAFEKSVHSANLSFLSNSHHRSNKSIQAPPPLCMGLYDEPLPPPPKNNNNSDGNESSDDAKLKEERLILFEFDKDGNELSGVLPPLKRTLRSGIPCYYEPNDPLVRLLVKKSNCNPLDAAWALEANRGNVVDAGVSISLAQRNALKKSVSLPSEEEVSNVDWDEQMKEFVRRRNASTAGELGPDFENDGLSLGLDGIEQRKEQLQKRAQKDARRSFWDSVDPDSDWLPGEQNPKPVDDEPWFTG